MEAALLTKWVEKEEKVASLSKRRYLHFDRFIDFGKTQDKLIRALSNDEQISRHAFYPFINTVLETPRYKKITNPDGTTQRVLDVKQRQIAYASHYDAFVYSWYATILNDEYEKQLETWDIKECVLAYLKNGNKSNIDYALETFKQIRNKSECAVIAIDIKGFFDNLDHEVLKKMWAKTLKTERLPATHFNIYKSLTAYSTVSKHKLDILFDIKNLKNRYCSAHEFRNLVRMNKLIQRNSFVNELAGSKRFGESCGIPQGSPISAILSNIYMINFDIALNQFSKTNNAFYRRYCDDIIIVCDADKVSDFINYLQTITKENELQINNSKTEIVFFSGITGKLRGYKEKGCLKYSNLQYLGFDFNGENAYIRASSISRYKRRLSSEIRECLKAANGRNSKSSVVFKKKMLSRFSSKGKRNFITYAIRAGKDVMNSNSIKKQYNKSIEKVLSTFKAKQLKYNFRLEKRNIKPKAIR